MHDILIEHEAFQLLLTKSGVSDNVGGVKHVATTLPHALEQERHFALIGEVLNPTKARFLISIQVGKLSVMESIALIDPL